MLNYFDYVLICSLSYRLYPVDKSRVNEFGESWEDSKDLAKKDSKDHAKKD